MKFRQSQLIFLALGLFLSSCSSPIQRQINVTKNLRSTAYLGFNFNYKQNILGSTGDGKKYTTALSYECLKYSIRQEDLNEMLSKGAKIVTSTNWEQAVRYKTNLYNQYSEKNYQEENDGTCLGISYIVEGKKSLLDKYTPGK